MDVFVTKSTLYSISGILDIEYEASSRARDSILNIIWEYSTMSILSEPEVDVLVKLISINEILNSETPESIKQKIKKQNSDRLNKARLIFTSDKKTYHYYDNCPKISSDYQNFTIPDEIPESKVGEYRKFFLDNISLFNEKPDLFYFNVSIKFGVKITSIGRLHHSNSGKANSQEMLKILESEAEPCVESISVALDLYQKNKKTIQKFGRASHLRDEFLKSNKMNKDEYSIICEWHFAKERVKGDIFQKITKINKITNHAYSDVILNALGFTPCSTCLELKNKN
ncbi:hypothetical protein [Raoultella ornithinolytica]|uniref:hypothetical protein n=1 Tax=Raoultella ornithinolytica TaxID=54291 RepID=UPI00301DE83C